MNTDSHQRVREERMRMSKVRRALGVALDGEAAVEDPVPVYLACSDYLKHALDRLHAQDHRLWERLDPHAGPNDKAFREKLDHLNDPPACQRRRPGRAGQGARCVARRRRA